MVKLFIKISHSPLFTNENMNLYNAMVIYKHLKILFTVSWSNVGFKVVSSDVLYLDGIDDKAKYPPDICNGDLCVDTSITKELFQDSLSPFGIVITPHFLIMHNFNFFETNNFIFSDSNKKELLYKAIIDEFEKDKVNLLTS